MTPRELYFILAPLGFGIFTVLALNTHFRHGWRHPYRWYTAAMVYLAACSLSFIPLLDFLSVPIHYRGLYVAHSILTSLFGPLLMLAFLRLSQCIGRVSAKILLVLLPPFVLFHLCYIFVADTPFLLYICLAYIAGVTLWWARSICLKVRFQFKRPLDDEEESPAVTGGDISWMRPYAIVIAVCVLLRWCVQAFYNPPASDWVKPQMLLIVMLYLPVILLYEWEHGELQYFSRLHKESAPKPAEPVSADPQPAEPMQRRDVRAAKVQMRSRAALPPNAILPRLVTQPLPSPSPELDGQPLTRQLALLEKEGIFFLDSLLTLGRLARLTGQPASALRAHFGATGFAAYLDRLRCAHAAQLLRNHPDAPLHRIARQSGFSSLAHFADAFASHYNLTPNQFRHANR